MPKTTCVRPSASLQFVQPATSVAKAPSSVAATGTAATAAAAEARLLLPGAVSREDGAQQTRTDWGFGGASVCLAEPNSGPGTEREDELLAGRFEPAGRAVQPVEDDPLDHAVNAAAGERRPRPARVRDRRRDAPRRPLAEFHPDERARPNQEREQEDNAAPESWRHCRTRRRAKNATARARAAKAAERRNAGRKARVIVSSIVPTSVSRVAAICGSVPAPRSLNGLARSGTSPAWARSNSPARSSATGTLVESPIGASSNNDVDFSFALRPASGSSAASSCAIEARVSTSTT